MLSHSYGGIRLHLVQGVKEDETKKCLVSKHEVWVDRSRDLSVFLRILTISEG